MFFQLLLILIYVLRFSFASTLQNQHQQFGELREQANDTTTPEILVKIKESGMPTGSRETLLSSTNGESETITKSRERELSTTNSELAIKGNEIVMASKSSVRGMFTESSETVTLIRNKDGEMITISRGGEFSTRSSEIRMSTGISANERSTVSTEIGISPKSSDSEISTGSSDSGMSVGSIETEMTASQIFSGRRERGGSARYREFGLSTGSGKRERSTVSRERVMPTTSFNTGISTVHGDGETSVGSGESGIFTKSRERKSISGIPVESFELTTESFLDNYIINETVNAIERYFKSLKKIGSKPKSKKIEHYSEKKYSDLNEIASVKSSADGSLAANLTRKLLSNNTRKRYRITAKALQKLSRKQKNIWIAFRLRGNCPKLYGMLTPTEVQSRIKTDMSVYLLVNESQISLNDIHCERRTVYLNVSVIQSAFILNEIDWLLKFRQEANINLIGRKLTIVSYSTKKSTIFSEKLTPRHSNKIYIILSYSCSLIAVTMLVLAGILYHCRYCFDSRKQKRGFNTDLFMAFEETPKTLNENCESDFQNYYGNVTDGAGIETTKSNDVPLSSTVTAEGEDSHLLQGELEKCMHTRIAEDHQPVEATRFSTFQHSDPRPVYHDFSDERSGGEELEDEEEESDFTDDEQSGQCDELDTTNLHENLWYIGNPLYTVRSTPDLGQDNKNLVQGSTESLGVTRVGYVHEGTPSFKYETDF